jgi:hypothetical protein
MNNILMKHYLRFFLGAILTLLFSTNSFAQGFEGTVSIEVNVTMWGGQPIPVTMSSKGAKSVMEMSMPMMGSMKMYIDRLAGKMITVMGQSGMEAPLNSETFKVTKTDNSTVKATGEKKDINGHHCELYTLTSREGVTDLWVTGDLPKSMIEMIKVSFKAGMQSFANGKAGGTASAFDEMTAKGLLPIRIEMKNDGKSIATISLTGYEEKKIDNSIFVVPSDVKITSNSEMGGGQ